MKLLSCIQPGKFLGIQHIQSIMREMPGHTAAIMQPSHVLCTLYMGIARMWHDFCALADLLNQPTSALFTIKMAGLDIIKTLEYSPVVKISETEGLLVHQSIIKNGFFLCFSCHVAANKEHIVPKYICTTRNIM